MTTKKTPAKKISANKKKATATVNPHAGKRYFMLEFGGYGGEFIVGRVSEDFVQYWLEQDNDSYLSDHIMAMHNQAGFGDIDNPDDEVPEGFDANSPNVVEDRKFVEYWELDDIEHDTVISKEYSSFTLQEIELHPDAVYQNGEVTWDDKKSSKKNFDWSQEMYTVKEDDSKDYKVEDVKQLYCTEMYVNSEKDTVQDPVPVLMMYDSQKGTFSRIYIETNGDDFDVSKLVVGVNENTMTTHVTEFFYDKVPLTVDNNYLSTWGKGFHCSVGYIPQADITYDRDELLKYGWRDLEE